MAQLRSGEKQVSTEKRQKCIKISYLNVQSMRSSDGHAKDVEKDNAIMDADIFGLGETWLEEDEEVQREGEAGPARRDRAAQE